LLAPVTQTGAVISLAEFFDHLAVKCRNILRFSACNQAVIHDDLLIHPFGARIAEISFQRRPARHRPSPHGAVLERVDGRASAGFFAFSKNESLDSFDFRD
jgi:hypothetical protein